jgi:TetR/AcrR family transcriptional repressor of nem operon
MDSAERLLDAASELMYQRGYEAVSVQDVCERADVRKGSFYYWFPSKAALAVAMLDADWRGTRARLFEPAFDPGLGSSGAPLERFDRFAGLLLAHNRRVRDREGAMLGCGFGNFAAELSARDAVVRAKLADVFADMRAYFERAIGDAVQAGDIPPTNISQASLAVLAHMEGLVLVAKAANDPDLMARFSEDVRALLGAPARPVGVVGKFAESP